MSWLVNKLTSGLTSVPITSPAFSRIPFAFLLVAVACSLGTVPALGQSPVAFDDSYYVPSGQLYVEDAPGVLGNDQDSRGEDLPPTATAQLVTDVPPADGSLTLNADGSFTFSPSGGFLGTSTFTYEVVLTPFVSNLALVTLEVSGCTPPATTATCWKQASFRDRLAQLGSTTIKEGFENDAVWGGVRTPNRAVSVVSQGVTWMGNNGTSEVTTGSGAARTGSWGFYELPHGNQTGNLTDPQRDGFIGISASPLIGVGAWIDSNTGGGQIQFALDGNTASPITFQDPAVGSQYKFFGVIHTPGFSQFEIYETEGVIEDQEFIFSDDFTLGLAPARALLVDDDNNAPDVRASYSAALNNLGAPFDVRDTSVEGEPDAAALAGYESVLWFTGADFGGTAGPSSTGEAALAGYLDGGGCLFVSSQDYLDDRGITSFMSGYLGVASGTADVGHTTVTGQGTAFGLSGVHDLTYIFSNFSDRISPDAVSELAFSGNSGDAAVNKDATGYRTIFLGFPFEAIADAPSRESVMATVLSYCDLSCVADFNVTVSNQAVSSPLVVEACNAIAGGPALEVTSPGALTLRARNFIRLDDGFSIESGTFTAETGSP